MSGRGLGPETVEQDPSQVKASKRFKQVKKGELKHSVMDIF